MGKVFSLKEICESQVPSPEDFKTVADFIREELTASPAITAAMFGGSYIRRDCTRRSDIDVIAVYPLTRRPEAILLLGGLESRAKMYSVPIGFVSLDESLALSPDHDIAAGFYEHFQSVVSTEAMVKANPLLFINPARMDKRADTRNYLSHKIRFFERGERSFRTLSEERRLHLLEKALAFPVYLGRMMLQCAGVPMPQGDGKAEVVRLYPTLGIRDATTLLEQVGELDRWYTTTLENILQQPDHEEYRRVLTRLEEAVPMAYWFARHNLTVLARL